MEVLLVAIMAVSCILCFVIGAKVGQTVSKGEDIKLPAVNPMQEAEMEQERLDTIMRNIESYDGTTRGQEDVPR